MNTKKNKLKEKTKELLERPGVYVMYDENRLKLYIGKSVNIKQRVASYWNKSGERSNKIRRMIQLVDDFQVYYTDTEFDALLLECKWIETFKPPYNTALTRLDKLIYFDIYKAHPYQIKISRAKNTRANRRFGPFANRRLVMQAYNYMLQNYPYFFCDYTRKKLDTTQCQSLMKHRCNRVCETKEIGLEDKLIDEIFYNGEALKKELEETMYQLSEAWEYEQAGELLKQIKGLHYISCIHIWTEEIKTISYIGRLNISGELTHKYYLIIKGTIIYTKIGYEVEEKYILHDLRKLYKMYNENPYESPNSYQLLILNNFKKNKMKIFRV